MTEASVRIVGHHLPGRSIGPHSNVHLGIQRGREVIEAVPADSPRAEFVVVLDVRPGADGAPDFFGPFAHGKRGARFVYLNWVDVGDDGAFDGFGRVKLLLSDLPELVVVALAGGGFVCAELGLTHGRGGPVYASVRAADVLWTVEHPGAAA
jgi:hypothetical protein